MSHTVYSVLQFISFPQDLGKALGVLLFLVSNFGTLVCGIYCVTVGFFDQGPVQQNWQKCPKLQGTLQEGLLHK